MRNGQQNVARWNRRCELGVRRVSADSAAHEGMGGRGPTLWIYYVTKSCQNGTLVLLLLTLSRRGWTGQAKQSNLIGSPLTGGATGGNPKNKSSGRQYDVPLHGSHVRNATGDVSDPFGPAHGLGGPREHARAFLSPWIALHRLRDYLVILQRRFCQPVKKNPACRYLSHSDPSGDDDSPGHAERASKGRSGVQVLATGHPFNWKAKLERKNETRGLGAGMAQFSRPLGR